ncbi:MAG: ferritin-like domain-containing protein [Chitinophagaceae bacterium]|nr:ferritin-like domain-containing protein [Chitinophagaceae bacterium]
MPEINPSGSETLLTRANSAGISRRRFLGYTGAAAAVVIGVSSCDKDDDNPPSNGIDLGSGDIGVLNYAYALEQLEAAFYIKVLQSPYTGGTVAEMALMADIRDHEIAHREFFKNVLAGNAIQALTPDFSTIDFTSRTSVLATAKAFEDTGVSAYNGAGKLLTNAAYLTVAGKIVSVEARHAAWIRDIISNGTFADSTAVDAQGLDLVATPPQVLVIANTYLTTKISGSNLPTS